MINRQIDKTAFKEELNSDEYKTEWNRFVEMRKSITYCLSFCYMNSLRDGISGERNFFLRMVDDIIQSVISIEIIAKEGIMNTCRRELRYLIELSIKSCLIVNNTTKKAFDEQITEYEKLLNSSNINPINTLRFTYLPGENEDEFKAEVKRLYGYLCKYSHSSAHQIRERLERAEIGRSIGFEGIQELKELNNDIERVLAVVIVMIFHSIAQYVVGDFMVEPDGQTVNWYFNKSKYINIIDQNFDYKHERQLLLPILKQQRLERIKF
ncbi:hypothetical protein EXU85_12900 [Spirosoma sp. KCTC 42546]|uniref:hypothetical protein n=1 Tax=Spirosoma sp. KCTC 42546 TaxID=2520506 RepID=UPI00115B19B1|nr:hypothetical protein [Spirosoma sp. KCTC 42546]QDK79451.1 hypothetical protein EXU85_12900 [Spirosoma sp. KCTC 42546]